MLKPQILYTEEYLSEKFSDIIIHDKQRQAQKTWISMLENKELEAETTNYRQFEDHILRDLLNFPEEILRKGKDQKQVEMAYKDPSGNWAALFEIKGHKTKDLFAKQGGYGKDSQDSPFIQTFTNMGRFTGIPIGICTNYQKFVLIDFFNRLEKCHEFDFLTTKNDDSKLKEFIGLFSYDALVLKKIHNTLRTESIDKDKKFTTEFYKLFHETRLMIIKAFKEKDEVSQGEAEYYTQIFLDRIIFLFFALDKGLILDKNQKSNSKLFANRILNQLQLDQCTKSSRKIFDDINLLFTALDEGDDTIPVHGFNGTLFSGKIPHKVYFLDFQDKHFFSEEFQNSKLSKPPKLSESHQKIFQEHEEFVNPIIRNLLILDSFDFNSKVNVTILGHILEQSIEDLDKLRKLGNTNRKINGVYYTPETVTDYVCKNTIIPFLSKNNNNTIHELILEYAEEINVLEEKINKIRIIDPACGSGAFLIKSAEILLMIIERIEEVKGAKQTQMSEFFPENEISKIIKNNIFGVDINEKSVEITKLSLFLKMAKINQKLENISKNIVKGNSLIDDNDVDSSSFDWNDKFPEVMQNGGFDIVIGNPPWQLVQPDVDEFFSPLKEMQLLLATEFPKKNQLFSKLTIHKKNAFMQKCLENSEINVIWEEYLSKYHDQKNYLLNPEKFRYQVPVINGKKPTGIGLNLYKLFVEKSHQILKKNGLMGFVLPSGIYADLGSGALRKLFYEHYEILELCGFINKKPIFEDVHKQFKFCTILLRKGKSTKKFLAKFNEFDDEVLKNFRKTSFTYDLDLIKMGSPDSLSILECKDQMDQRILQKQYKFPLLQQDEWNLEASREFNMTDDARFFHTGDVGLPLFQGDMIHMFTDSFSSAKYWVEEEEGTNELKRKELYRIKRASKQKNLKILPRIHSDEYRLVWRVQTNATNVRTLISTILPPNVFLGNSLNYFDPLNFDGEKYYKPTSSKELIFLCGIFNSFTSDFIIRHKVSSNLNMFYLMELPIPRFDNTNPLHNKIFKNSSKLICTTDKFLKLREEVGISEFILEPNKRLTLEAQINACAAKIYDLSRDELEYVLELFPSVDQKLKDLTLDEFSLL